MTLLEDPPAAGVRPVEPARPAVPSAARWRLAARLARREVRRRPGRTALVTLLVAGPVMAMVFGSVLVRTQADTWAEKFQRTGGQADVRLEMWDSDGRATTGTGLTDEEWTARLPAGSTFERYGRTYALASGGGQTSFIQFLDFDLDAPLVRGVVEVRDGRAPTAADEIALDRSTADHFDVGVGDVLTLDSPAGDWTVTGIVRHSDSFREPLFIFGEFDWERVAAGHRGEQIFIDLPAGTSPEETAALVGELGAFGNAFARDVLPGFIDSDTGEPSTAAMAWGWVAGALALCVVSIVIASAFATSARRQLVSLGQLSANGADRRLLRRTLALQGSWSGLIGSIAGVGVALVALVLSHDLAEFVVSRRLGSYEIAAGDLAIVVVTGVAAATVAALVPARSTVRVPVLAALAGRRPLGVVPRRLVPIGLALFAGGTALMAFAAAASTGGDGSNANLHAAVAVLGGLGALFGMCCITPLAVDAVGRVGARAAGSWRLAARSLARTRTRSAGVVTAIAATAAFAIAGSTALATSQIEHHYPDEILNVPLDAVIVTSAVWPEYDFENGIVDPPLYTPITITDELVDQVMAITGGTSTVRRAAVWDPAPFPEDRYGTSAEGLPMDVTGSMVIADPVVLEMIGLSERDRARLDEIGAMTLFDVSGGEVEESFEQVIDIEGSGERTFRVAATTEAFESQGGVWGTLVTEKAARELGLAVVDDAVVVRAAEDLNGDQLRRLMDLQRELNPAEFGPLVFDVPETGTDTAEPVQIVAPPYPGNDVRTDLIQLSIAAAALLLTLFVVAVGLALSAAESRDERDVLTAVGAKPSTLRRVAAEKAVLMSLTGTLLALPAGLLLIVAVLRAIDDGNPGPTPIDVSWLTLGLLVLGVPLLAGVVTWIGSSIAQRLRPVHMSTLHAD